jgi:hypothetical protein
MAKLQTMVQTTGIPIMELLPWTAIAEQVETNTHHFILLASTLARNPGVRLESYSYPLPSHCRNGAQAQDLVQTIERS